MSRVSEPDLARSGPNFGGRLTLKSKGFQMVAFMGSTQEKSAAELFHFGGRKAANDKKVPDPVDSRSFVSQQLA